MYTEALGPHSPSPTRRAASQARWATALFIHDSRPAIAPSIRRAIYRPLCARRQDTSDSLVLVCGWRFPAATSASPEEIHGIIVVENQDDVHELWRAYSTSVVGRETSAHVHASSGVSDVVVHAPRSKWAEQAHWQGNSIGAKTTEAKVWMRKIRYGQAIESPPGEELLRLALLEHLRITCLHCVRGLPSVYLHAWRGSGRRTRIQSDAMLCVALLFMRDKDDLGAGNAKTLARHVAGSTKSSAHVSFAVGTMCDEGRGTMRGEGGGDVVKQGGSRSCRFG
ncbi:hypothetical protein C8R45DRAFT_1101623 [Mycena sanguinolenta]|nr:hypothetical protein C8R45DRAFT_1101623 [Mycena sanguinolenta]